MYRSIAVWPANKKRAIDAPEVKKYSDQFCEIFKHFARTAKDYDDVAVVMAWISAMIAMFSTKYIACPDFDLNSETQEECSDARLEEIAAKFAALIWEQSRSIGITSDEELELKLAKLMEVNHKPNQQHFVGYDVAKDMIDVLEDSLVFSCPYLHSKDDAKKTGVIRVVVVYFPFDGCFDLEPQCVDEFSFTVDLPFTKKKLKNRLYSPRSAEYLRSFWLKRVSLLTRTIVSTIEKRLKT